MRFIRVGRCNIAKLINWTMNADSSECPEIMPTAVAVVFFK